LPSWHLLFFRLLDFICVTFWSRILVAVAAYRGFISRCFEWCGALFVKFSYAKLVDADVLLPWVESELSGQGVVMGITSNTPVGPHACRFRKAFLHG
jgi:hypothetical protein